MFDLSTNPQESEGGKDELNLNLATSRSGPEACPPYEFSLCPNVDDEENRTTDPLCNVQRHLECRVKPWLPCVTTGAKDIACDEEVAPLQGEN